MTEAEYVKKHKENGNKKEAGKGDAWEKAWVEDRENIAIHRENAKINMDAVIVETANKDKVLAKIAIEKSPGGAWYGNDFDTAEQ
jgi:hypothetical protein